MSCAPHLNSVARTSIPAKLSGNESSLDTGLWALAVREICFPMESSYFTQEAPCLQESCRTAKLLAAWL